MITKAAADMSTPNFRFKQFTVWHDRCAMKVGTDGVLLGAWAPVSCSQETFTHSSIRLSPLRVLDIGTGSGLVALMIAQRWQEAQIDAIDIDADAVAQAQDNFARSPWSERLHAHHSSLQKWQTAHRTSSLRPLSYDLIVSNPPYFQNSLKNPDAGRQTARHTDTLSYNELIAHSVRLLKPDGSLALILPAEAETEICTLAQEQGLTLARLTRVFSKESKPARRVLMSFVRNHETTQSRDHEIRPSCSPDTLVLEDDRGARSAAYRLLAQDFYL